MSGKGSKARAKISDIIADAKASLAEPTRPVTPAGGFTPHGVGPASRSMSSATVTSMYANQYSASTSVSASYSGRSAGAVGVLNALRTKRLKPLNHISSTVDDDGGNGNEEEEEGPDAEPETYARSFTQGPSQSGQGRYQMQSFGGDGGGDDAAAEEVVDFDYDAAAEDAEAEEDDCYDGSRYRTTGGRDRDRDSDSPARGGEFISLLNDVNDAIDNLSNVHALLANSCKSVTTNASASAGSSASRVPAPPASASYSPEIAFILSSLCSGGDNLLERISRSSNTSDDFIWSLESLMSTLCATVETCLQLTAAPAAGDKAGGGQGSAVVTANLQLYFMVLVLVRACLRVLLTKLRAGVFVLETNPMAGGNALTTSSFTVTTNVSTFLLTLLQANQHIAHYIFANARSLAHISESAVWGGCLCADNAAGAGSSSATGPGGDGNIYSLARADITTILSADYCIAVADYLASERLLRMAEDATATATGAPVRREEGSDERALRCLDCCVGTVHALLNSTQNPECAAHKLKLLMLPLVSHVYTVLYYCYCCVYRLASVAHKTAVGKRAGGEKVRTKRLDICVLGFDGYRDIWRVACTIGGELMPAVAGLITKYLYIVREYLNSATTGAIRVDEKFRRQLVQCHGLDAEKPALVRVGVGAAAAPSAANSPFNPLETPLVLLLFHVMFALQHNAEVSLYSVRVLAKLTVFEQVRQICYSKSKFVIACLVSGPVIREAREAEEASEGEVDRWPAWHSFPLLSRGVYILGNLTTTNERNRQVLADFPGFLRSLRVLLVRCGDMFHSHLFPDGKDASDGGSDSKAGGRKGAVGGGAEVEEVIIKVIRLVANTSINAECGRLMVQQPPSSERSIGSVSASILELVVRVLKHVINRHGEISGNAVGAYPGPGTGTRDEAPGPHEELLLNAVASITNLTFYATEQSRNSADMGTDAKCADDEEDGETYAVPVSLLCTLTKSLSLYLYHPNMEIVMEIIRAFGNLSRCRAVVQVVVQYDIQLILISLLTSPAPRLRHSVVGILINLSCDETCRRYLLHGGTGANTDAGTDRHLLAQLLAVLKKTKFNQTLSLQTSILACQVLCNFLGDIKALIAPVGADADADDVNAEECAQKEQIRDLCGRLRDCLEELVDCARDLTVSHEDVSARPTTAAAARSDSQQLVSLLADLVKYGEIVFNSL